MTTKILKCILAATISLAFILIISSQIAAASTYTANGYYITANIETQWYSYHTVTRSGDQACCGGSGHIWYFENGRDKNKAVYGSGTGGWFGGGTIIEGDRNYIKRATTTADGSTVTDLR